MKQSFVFLAFLTVLLAASPENAQAYVGPGLGLGAIGAILGVVLSVLLALFAIIWYPIKRLLGLDKKVKPQPALEKKDQ